MKKFFILFILFTAIAGLFAPQVFSQEGKRAAALYTSPATGAFTVGSTFTVSFYLNTGGQFINAVEADISFPPDKLQVVSPSTGISFINVWTIQPTYSNSLGTIRFQGAIPNPGINTEAGLISTVTFRVKNVGAAIVKFTDKSKALLNDGLGTDILGQTGSGIYQLILPAPEGPIVVSASHPDQQKWYNSANIILNWASEDPKIQGFSYVLNREPVDMPDDISEENRAGVTYKNVADGIYYFHIKALRNGLWGGATHFAVKVDAAPPAEFPIEISPGNRTTRIRPIISFITTDNLSGIDRYEIKIVSLSQGESQPFFIETGSPYAPELVLGSYDVIVRAVDRAGNFIDSKTHIEIVKAVFEFVSGEGIQIRGGAITIPWLGFWATIAAFILLLIYLGWKVRRWHRSKHDNLLTGALNDPIIKNRLEELKSKQEEYRKIILILLIFGLSLLFGAANVSAQINAIAPPLVNLFSKNISNEELFYIGGKTEAPGSQVIIYLQNIQTGETLSETVAADKVGNWFYSHPKFLTAGRYMLWTQAKIGNDLSPPSPQFQLKVSPTAIQFGSSRLSLEVLYLIISLILLAAVIGLSVFIIYHFYHGRKKTRRFRKEIGEAEESIRRGFAILRRDIEAELAVIAKAKLSKALSEEEKEKEEKLLRDLDWVQKYITKEVWDIEKTERI